MKKLPTKSYTVRISADHKYYDQHAQFIHTNVYVIAVSTYVNALKSLKKRF